MHQASISSEEETPLGRRVAPGLTQTNPAERLVALADVLLLALGASSTADNYEQDLKSYLSTHEHYSLAEKQPKWISMHVLRPAYQVKSTFAILQGLADIQLAAACGGGGQREIDGALQRNRTNVFCILVQAWGLEQMPFGLIDGLAWGPTWAAAPRSATCLAPCILGCASCT